MHVLIADDEAPARGELRYILGALLPEATFYEAVNGEDVLRLVADEPIEVVFLDIHMPGLDGMAVAAAIVEELDPPLIVFATAYDEHAVRAFELAALDYVVKPFDEERLARTVQRIRRARETEDRWGQQRAALRTYLRQVQPAAGLSKLWGERENGNRLLVDYHDILWLEALDKRTYAQTAAGEKLLVRYTLKELEPRLGEYNFTRAHRSYLVNLDYVAEVVPWFSGTYLVRMADEARTEIPLSRRYAARLKEQTGWR